mmetsp:Transcript_1156/g.4269  ORF Transcript_1156/g.4269 Transcript_1156/m.4269 type:complete len:366 (+) Transcript_1156:759-1856(+)
MALRCVSSANAVCAFLMASKASRASTCEHLSGCTMSDNFQYFFLMTAAVSSGETLRMSYASPPREMMRAIRIAHASRDSLLVSSISATISGGGGPTPSLIASAAAAASSILFGGTIGPNTRFTGSSSTAPDGPIDGPMAGPIFAIGATSSTSLSLPLCSAINATASSPVKIRPGPSGRDFAALAARDSSFLAFSAATTSGSGPSQGSRASEYRSATDSSKTKLNRLHNPKSLDLGSVHDPVALDFRMHACSKKYSRYLRTRSSATPLVDTPRPSSTARNNALKFSRSLANFANICRNASAASCAISTCWRIVNELVSSLELSLSDDDDEDDEDTPRRLVRFPVFPSFFRRLRSSELPDDLLDERL